MIGCAPQPSQTFRGIARNAFPKQIHEAKVVLCIGMAAFSGTAVPLSSPNRIVRSRPVAGRVESTQIALPLQAAQFAGFDEQRISLGAIRV